MGRIIMDCFNFYETVRLLAVLLAGFISMDSICKPPILTEPLIKNEYEVESFFYRLWWVAVAQEVSEKRANIFWSPFMKNVTYLPS